MCNFISAWYNIKTLEIKAYHLTSHYYTQWACLLSEREGWREMHYLTNGSIECRNIKEDKVRGETVAGIYKKEFPTAERFLEYCIKKIEADVNARCVGGETALHRVVSKNDMRGCELLLRAGADVNLKDDFDATPLYWGVLEGNRAMVKLLLENGADPNIQNIDGRPPLYWAIRNNKVELAELLLKYGADPFVTTNCGEKVLFLAHSNEMQWLLEQAIQKKIKKVKRGRNNGRLNANK